MNTINETYTFLGTCDTLRRKGGEDLWKEMMNNKSKIEKEEFLKDLDASKLLDDDVTIEDYLDNLESEDTIEYYESNWGDKNCKFIKTSGDNGFEFIFTEKGMNENMKDKIKRFIKENLDFSGFKMNDTLNPVIFDDNMKMKEEISDALLQIAKDYFISLKINIPVKDITMTGSLSNYNWSKYSDVDLHIIIDLDKMGDKKDMVKDLLDAKTRAWNDKHDITVKGYDVELYLQPYDQEHFSTGVYSILNDEFVIEPKIQDDSIDKKNVVKKYNSIVNTVNDIHKDFAKKKDYKDVISRLESLSDKIKKTRTAGLEGKGEYSLENIVFKLLRRNNIMEKISNLLAKAYDESMSIDEELINTIKEEDIR